MEILIKDRFYIKWTYSSKHEFLDHAENEVGPEYVQTEEDHQHHIEEVVAKKGGVVVKGVHPGTVDEPKIQAEYKQVNICDVSVIRVLQRCCSAA